MIGNVISIFKNLLNEDERKEKIYYIKSLSFLILIIVLISDFNWNMTDDIKLLLSDRVLNTVIKITEMLICVFTTLAKISFCIMIVSLILNGIAETNKIKYLEKNCNNNYFYKVARGAELRFESCIENILLCLMLELIFDWNLVVDYIMHFDIICFVPFVIGVVACVGTIIKGILNRFFVIN
mgnify:CR=1 FL=1